MVLRVIPFFSETDAPVVVAARLLVGLCADEGVATIDIEPLLRAHGHRDFGVSRWDNHPTAECHALFGEMVAAELLCLWGRGQLKPRNGPAGSGKAQVGSGGRP